MQEQQEQPINSTLTDFIMQWQTFTPDSHPKIGDKFLLMNREKSIIRTVQKWGIDTEKFDTYCKDSYKFFIIPKNNDK